MKTVFRLAAVAAAMSFSASVFAAAAVGQMAPAFSARTPPALPKFGTISN